MIRPSSDPIQFSFNCKSYAPTAKIEFENSLNTWFKFLFTFQNKMATRGGRGGKSQSTGRKPPPGPIKDDKKPASMSDKLKALKEKVTEEITTASTLSPENYKEFIQEKQRLGLFPELSATTVHLFNLEKQGKDNSITIAEWMHMYPGACNPNTNYKTIHNGNVKVKEDIAKWKSKNATLAEVLDALISQKAGISKEIDYKVDESKQELLAIIEEQNERILKLEKRNEKNEKNIRIIGFISREIIVGGQDWQDIEKDFPALRQRAEEFLVQFMEDKTQTDFVKRVTKLQGKNKDGTLSEYYRWRIIVRKDATHQEIIDNATKDPKYKHLIKPGKMPDHREVSNARWPFTVASYHFNFNSQEEMAEARTLNPMDPDYSDIHLCRIEKDKNGEFKLGRYLCTDENRVGLIFKKALAMELIDNKNFTEVDHGKHIPCELSA